MSALAACTSPEKQNSVSEEITNLEGDPKTPVINLYSGIVTEIQMGKDGFTAQLKTIKDGTVIFATISRANLNQPETYRQLEIGDTIQVMGEEWQMENQTHLTVRELK